MLGQKNKKGIMLAETVLKIVVAVLCIAVLVILAGKLLGMFSDENKVRKAEDNLNLIAEKITFLKGPDYTKDFLYVAIYPTTGWFMKNFRKEDGFPDKQCVGRFESCLCICKGVECLGLKACKGLEDEMIMEVFPTGTFDEGVQIRGVSGDPQKSDCYYWYEHEQWNNNAASSCIDLKGIGQKEGATMIIEHHKEVLVGGKTFGILEFTGAIEELKISEEGEIIKISKSDRA